MIVENWNEFLLFYHVDNYNITYDNSETVKRYIVCPFKINRLNRIHKDKHIYFNYIWCDILVELISNNIFYKKVKKYIPKKYMNKKFKIVFFIYHQIFNHILIVNKNIIRHVNHFIKCFNSKYYIGIQIRVGNAELKEKQFSDQNDVNLMLNIASQHTEYKKWFLTGGSYKLKIKLSKKYNRIIIFSKNKTLHYNNHKKDTSAIVENEILSKSKFIIISQSTYGLVALLKSGLLLKEIKNLSFLIKKGKIFNVNEYFKDITSKWYM